MARFRVLALGVSAVCAACAAILACSSFSGSGNDTAPDADALAPDTSPLPDAGADVTIRPVPDAADNLLANPDFERGCAGWSTLTGGHLTGIKDPQFARTGSGSCLVCPPDTGGYELRQSTSTPMAVMPGAEYTAGVYLRKAPDGRSPTNLNVRIDLNSATDSTVDRSPETPAPALDTTWQKAPALFTVKSDAGAKLVLIVKAMDLGGCFLVDDAWLRRTK